MSRHTITATLAALAAAVTLTACGNQEAIAPASTRVDTSQAKACDPGARVFESDVVKGARPCPSRRYESDIVRDEAARQAR